jgi:thiamine biosynthesis lipoprotein
MVDIFQKDEVVIDRDRRSFLKLSGLLGLGMASAGLFPAAAEAVRFNRKMYKVSKTRLAMGTFVSMTLVHSSRDHAEEAMGKAFDEIHRLTGLLNRFDEKTAVSQINKEGFVKDIPPEVAFVVDRALEYHRLTQGIFDISVKPVVDLFKEKLAGSGEAVIQEKELREALELVDARQIEIQDGTITFKRHGMGMTLDGIAKGYIVDRASGLLTHLGIENHLINAGGDIKTMGSRPDRKPWTVAIQDPQKERHYPDIVHLNNGAIATSGNYEIYFDREKLFHHIVDPRTGLSPRLNTSVSVMALTAMAADALATSVFVMNPLDGKDFIDSLPRCECFVITREGHPLKSRGWKSAAI